MVVLLELARELLVAFAYARVGHEVWPDLGPLLARWGANDKMGGSHQQPRNLAHFPALRDPVKQPALVALVASAFVLYLVASAGAGGVPLDAGSLGLSLVAGWSGLTPLWIKRDELSPAPALVRALAALLALALASSLAIGVHSLLGELVCVTSLPALALVTLHLALFAPDTPPRLARHVGSMVFVRWLGLASAAVALLAVLPPIWIYGRALILPYWLFQAPLVFSLSAFVLALALRLFRRRLGSDTRSLSANVWAMLGLCGALGLSSLAGILHWLSLFGARELRFALALSAAMLLLGHMWLVSTRRAKVAHAWARELFALVLAFAMAGALLIWARPYAVLNPVSLLLSLLLGVFAFELGKLVFRRLARLLLAPQRGELLSAVDEIRQGTSNAQTYEELSANVLRPLRRAAGSPEAAPLLFSLHPGQELRLDAAGFARITSRPLPESLRGRLESAPSAVIVRDDLRQKLSRRPELRELVWALDELSALCVLPLVTDGTVDGALVVAQGSRRDPLSLEELEALEGLTRFIAPLLAVMSMVERMRARLSTQDVERAALAEKLCDATDELEDARSGLSLLKAVSSPLMSYREPIRYSPAMRELFAHLSEVANQDVPVTLLAEPGTALVPLAEYLHRTGGRRAGPFVIGECGSLLEGDALGQLLGVAPSDLRSHARGRASTPREGEATGQAKRLGLLQLAHGGSLLLLDVVALAHDAQRALATALSTRRACPVGSTAWYPVDVRLIASARRSVEELLARGALVPELARWLSPTTYRVPPLRECREDIESLALLAIDRAGRVLGKNVPGLAPGALAVLKEHDYPLNHLELESAVERAVANAGGLRIELGDLPPLPTGTLVSGSFIEQERDILRRALDHAGGNRTRAARALGLKRTTLIEKLRKLGIEEGRSGTEH